MKRISLALSVVSFLTAIAVFLLAEPPRSVYSGLLFLVFGVVLLMNSLRSN